MNLKKQSELKINKCNNCSRNNESIKSEILKILNDMDYGKMVIGLGGLSVCIPYIFPSIPVNQIMPFISNIPSAMLHTSLMGIAGISAYSFIEILVETLKDKKIEFNKDTTSEVDVNDLITNMNKQLLECSISKDEF